MSLFQIKLFTFVTICLVLAGCSEDASDRAASNSQYVLAFSWQPAFCETAKRKRECRTQDKYRYDAVHFSLHGLWPQPGSNIYCGVNDDQIKLDKRGRWRDLDAARVEEGVWQNLRRVMPGTMSSLHKHEWVKHGTCSPADIDEYYAQSIWILETINGSKLRDLFEANIGKKVSGDAIRNAFDASFGKGAGDRLRISCKRDKDSDRQMIVEMTIGLSDPFGKEADLAQLIMAAPKTDPGCPAGIVDPVGFQ